MRVAFFTTRMLLGYGVDLTIHEIARRLVSDYGHQVDVWTPTSDGTYSSETYGLREIIVYGKSMNRALAVLEFNARKAMQALSEKLAADGETYDLVIPCTHPYYAAGQIFELPSIFFNFGNAPTTGFGFKSKVNWAWLDFSEKALLKPIATRIVSISRFLHLQQGADFQRKGDVVHLAGDHYASSDPDLGRAFREKYGIPPDAVAMGYCGRMHKNHANYKGNHELLELGRRVRSVRKDAVLVACGLGSEEDADWIREQGAIPVLNLPPSEMPGFYEAIDIYITASMWEGFNLPLVEAAWHAVPGIAYDAGAHREHVTSVLVPAGEFDELCSAALTVVRDSRLRSELALQAHRRAEDFSWDKTTREFEAVMQEAVR